MRFIKLRPARTDRIGYVLAFALCAVSFLAYALLEPEPHTHFLFPTLYPAIIAAGWHGGFAAAATERSSPPPEAPTVLRPTRSFAVPILTPSSRSACSSPAA
jgi:hypothetical protein